MMAKHWSHMVLASMALMVGGVGGMAAVKAPVVRHRPVTITLGGWAAYPSNNVQKMYTFLKPFERQYPWIHVKYQPVAGNYETVLKTEYVAGDAADVVALNNGGQASPFIDAGDVLPLNRFLKAAHASSRQFFSGTTSLFTYRGKLYAIPRDQDVLGLFYNKTLFAKAGIKSPPKNWAQLAADAKILTDPKAHIYGIGIDPAEAYWGEFVLQAGGQIFNAGKRRMELNTKAALRGFAYYVNLYRKGWAAEPSQVGASWSGQSFGIGRVAMTIEGGWLIGSLAQDWPKIKYGIAALPKGPVNRDTFSYPVGWAISKTCKHPQAAWDLINYMTGRGQPAWVAGTDALPTRPSVTHIAYFTQHAVWTPLVRSLPVAKAWTFPNGFDQFANTTLNNQTLLAVQGQESPAQALRNLQRSGQQAFQSQSGR